jgi:hypothetical protein
MWGNYSKDSLEKQGLKLCDQENIENYITKSKPADIIFLHTRISFISWLVMYYTNSLLSHTAVVINKDLILEAIPQGVVKTPIRDYIDNKSYFVVLNVPDITEEQTADIMNYADSQMGVGYNWSLVFKIFLDTIFAKRKDWRIKFSLDFYLLFILLKVINLISLKLLVILSVIYTIIIVFNRTRFYFNNREHN